MTHPLHPTPQTAAIPIRCCLEGPEDYVPKARYAVEMLLFGLGLAPIWVGQDELGEAGLYYGPNPDRFKNGVLALRLQAETSAYFSERRQLQTREIGQVNWDGVDWPIPFAGEDGSWPDVVAAAFFWLSGWQEYTTVERDQHGRFPYAASLQAAQNCAMQPLVDVYRMWLGARLAEHGVALPGRSWNTKQWAVALTHDVDFVETRKRSRLKSFAQGKLAVAFGGLGKNDARRSSLYKIHAAETARDVRATYFFKGGASTLEDVGYRLDTPWLRRFIDRLTNEGFEIGLHPGYAAFDHPQRFRDELSTVTKSAGRELTSVRTHFLRWVEPTTPRLIDQNGFRIDSSLGFSKQEGFRRATCHPFRLFDIHANRSLETWEMPLAVMDSTLFSHRNFSTEQATEQIQAIFDATKRVRGCAVLLWHNTMYDEVNFPGQAAVFESTLDSALNTGAFVGSLSEVVREYAGTQPVGRNPTPQQIGL